MLIELAWIPLLRHHQPLAVVWDVACVCVCVCVLLFLGMSNSMRDPGGCSPPGSSVHGILQGRIQGWVAIYFSRGSSPPRDRTCLMSPALAGGFFPTSANWEARDLVQLPPILREMSTVSISEIRKVRCRKMKVLAFCLNNYAWWSRLILPWKHPNFTLCLHSSMRVWHRLLMPGSLRLSSPEWPSNICVCRRKRL